MKSLKESLQKGEQVQGIAETESERETAQQQFAIQKADLDLKREDLENRKQNLNLRKAYANKVFGLTAIYLSFVLVLIFFVGLSPWGFSLSGSVVIALITTTTANVFGFFLIITRYLFPSDKRD